MADYSLEKWYSGISWRSTKYWRRVVANIIGRPEAVPEVYGPFKQCLPTHQVIPVHQPLAVPADDLPAVVARQPKTTRTSLSLWRNWLAVVQPTNIVSGRQPVSNYVRHSGTGFRSPSRCRKSGSRYPSKPDYTALATVIGSQAVADVLAVPVSDNRRLELLGSIILTRKTVAVVQRTERTRDGIGFADCCDRTIGTMQSHIVPNDEADTVLLRLIARQSACESDRLVLAGKVETVAESLKTGLSIAWKAGLTDEKIAELLAVSTRTVERYRRKVAEAVSGFASVLPK